MAYEYVVLDEEPVESKPGEWARIPVWWEDAGAFGEVFVSRTGEADVSVHDPRFALAACPVIAGPRKAWKKIVGVGR